MRGVKLLSLGIAFKMDSRYVTAADVVVMGGFKFGITIALPKFLAL